MTESARQDTRLIDARWLGYGGAGRATQLLLRGLRGLAPDGDWVLWGGAAAEDYLWGSARLVRAVSHPGALAGQRSFFEIPPHSAGIFMHQIRPLRRGPSVTLMHDTIPVRYGGPAWKRAFKKRFFAAAAGCSPRLITVSEFSKRSIIDDLGVPSEAISVIRYPVDYELAARVATLRRELATRDTVLYVGRFAAHKNLFRLIRAFALTEVAAHGGQLLLVGGTLGECNAVRSAVRELGVREVSVRASCADRELEQLYATSACLVMPSLEEGFGLPAWEALSCGLPVCCSARGALAEFAVSDELTFDPCDVEAMASAIDAAVLVGDRTIARAQGADVAAFAAAMVREMESAGESFSAARDARLPVRRGIVPGSGRR